MVLNSFASSASAQENAKVVLDQTARDMPIRLANKMRPGKLLQVDVPVEGFAPIARKRAPHCLHEPGRESLRLPWQTE